MKTIFLFLTSYLLINSSIAAEIKNLDGFWFECEFGNKTTPPVDQCNMLDDDGFKFEKNQLIHVKNISSKEENCKKNRIGQCFKSNAESIVVKYGRKDKIKFKDSILVISFLGCDQNYKLYDRSNYVQAIPDKKKCIWTGKKNFFIKKYIGKIIAAE